MDSMKKGLIVIAIISGLVNSPSPSIVQAQEMAPLRKAGEILIKVRHDNTGSSAQFVSSGINNVSQQLGIKSMHQVFSTASHNSGQGQAIVPQDLQKSNELSQWFTVSLSADQDPEQVIKAYQNSGFVESAEPVYEYGIASTPNDQFFNETGTWNQAYSDQWGLQAMQMEKAWNVSRGSSDIIVAVIDTGLDYTHPDIIDNVWHNTSGIFDGLENDDMGWNFVDDNNNIMDTHGHGTHVAGIIGAVGNNAMGITGVCWQVKIMALKGLSDSGNGASTSLARAIAYAADHGARVINISWGGYGTSALIQDALDYAYNHNCVIVAAAGNNNTDAGRFFPGNYIHAICVAACDANGQKASFSNYGAIVDVTAPGVDILSLRAKGTDMSHNEADIVGVNYYRASGTSMATPFVSGLAALILAKDSEFTNLQVEDAIIKSANDLGQAGKDDYYGYGEVDAARALTLDTSEEVKIADFNAFDTPSDDGDSLTVTWPANSGAAIKGYAVYYALHPFTGITDDGVQVCINSPVSDPQATQCVISGLAEGQGYYIAVVASLNSTNSRISSVSASAAGTLSSTQPVYPVHNIVRTSNGPDTIFWGSDYQTKVILPQDPTNDQKILNITQPAENKINMVSSADNKLLAQIKTATVEELSSAVMEFRSNEVLNGCVTVQLSYPAGIVGWQESNLKIYTLDESTTMWQEVSGQQIVHRDERNVSVEIPGSTLVQGKVFRLFSMAGSLETLDEVKVFPNPYKPNSGLGHTKITFTNLIPESTIKIYDLTGALVRTLSDDSAQGQVDWDASNDGGQKAASGLYIFLVNSPDGKHKAGKLAIIK